MGKGGGVKGEGDRGMGIRGKGGDWGEGKERGIGKVEREKERRNEGIKGIWEEGREEEEDRWEKN